MDVTVSRMTAIGSLTFCAALATNGACSSLSIADGDAAAFTILTTCLTWAIDHGVEICNSAVPYLERTKSRPAYQFAAAANTPRK